MTIHVRAALAVVMLGALGLGGCGPALMAGVATTGVVLAQDRTVGEAIDDATLQFNLRQRLYNASHDDFTGVDLEVVEGRVLMTGRVDDQETRIEASRIAWTTPGVDDVINEVNISEQRYGMIRPRDAWITTQLRARLIGDTNVRQVNYHIETLQGTVYLFGVAQDEGELARVSEHAEAIGGVERIVSHMRVKDDPYARPAAQPYANQPAADPYASTYGETYSDPYADTAVDPYADLYDPYSAPAIDPYDEPSREPITQPVVGEPLELPDASGERGA